MLKEINLLPKNSKKFRNINRTIKYLKYLSRFIAVMVVVVIAAEWGWLSVTNLRISQTKDRIKNINDEISQKQDIEGRYIYYQKVLDNAAQNIEKRTNYIEIIEALYTMIPTGVSIENVNFVDKVLVFQGRAKNVQDFTSAIDNFAKNSPATNIFGNISITNINRDANGTYLFRLEIELVSKKIAATTDGNQ